MARVLPVSGSTMVARGVATKSAAMFDFPLKRKGGPCVVSDRVPEGRESESCFQ